MGATDAQRTAVAGRTCIVCGTDRRIDPAHLIPRSIGGCGDPLCVVPACRRPSPGLRSRRLDLLPYLEPAWRAQLAHAVGHVGLIGALRRISGRRQPAMHDQRGVSDADWWTGAGGSLEDMPTLVRDPQPAEFEALLERRRRLGQDLFDEVWEGVLHMNPAPSGRHATIEAQLSRSCRPPAAAAGLTVRRPVQPGGGRARLPRTGRRPAPGLHRSRLLPTAALVIEIVSPGDESWEKLDFYAAHGVEELLIVDPQEQTVSWMGLEAGEYKHLKRSRLIELGASELAAGIDWP